MGASLKAPDRRLLRVRGLVQGVGFRPFVFRLAAQHGVGGLVRNDGEGVWIEAEGDAAALDALEADLRSCAPPSARVLDIHSLPQDPLGESSFRIERSQSEPQAAATIPPDLAVCDACLRDTFDSSDRRRGYAFTSCSECGPRFTMQSGAPYDRERTSMAEFPLCASCRAEYEDPQDRRHHAEGTACPDCGPRVRLLSRDGQDLPSCDPIGDAARALQRGQIVAVKGLGGYHLAALADRNDVVAELRRRKGRDEKPFALMVLDAAAARRLCDLSPEEETLLGSPQRPIVLLRRRDETAIAQDVARGNPLLGVMLPYTPIHYMLLRSLGGAPLVLTSGNSSDLPIAQDNDEALAKLAGIADLFLAHDRAVLSRADDSVARIVSGELLLLRRSRGYAPAPLSLPLKLSKRTLALGGAFKATFALGRENEAILSHHLGDLGAYKAYRACLESIAHYVHLFNFRPERTGQ